jgi:hypothetical protein
MIILGDSKATTSMTEGDKGTKKMNQSSTAFDIVSVYYMNSWIKSAPLDVVIT